MAKFLATIRFIAGALALAFIVATFTPAPVSAQNGPTAATSEQQLLNQLHGGVISGQVSIPDKKSANLIHPAGREWREFRTVTLRWIGGIAILGILAVLVIFYLVRGQVKLESGRSGRTIVRFNAFERFVHWMTATCFIILAISGLNITFGRPLLLPILGPEAFTAWSDWARLSHHYLSFPFTLGVVLIFLMWIGGNIPNMVDVQWFKRGGGMVGHDHPPAYRFNGGQKAIYWIVVIGGGAVAATGYLLMFPFYGTTVSGMETAEIVHAVVAVLFVAAMLGHIYIGTMGMEGAFEAMGEGTVDVNWAKEHHSLWLEEEMAQSKGAGQARPMGTPAE
ncbi:MAG: formate dehydrogenase subunit gamma [Pseudolabrys sp.]